MLQWNNELSVRSVVCQAMSLTFFQQIVVAKSCIPYLLYHQNIVCTYHIHIVLFNVLYQEDWLENNIYQEMALTASAFAYTWSKWNADCGKDKIIIQAVEKLHDEQPLEVNKPIKHAQSLS